MEFVHRRRRGTRQGAQKTSLDEIEKRDTISGEWYRAFQNALNSSVFARIENRDEVESLFYQADAKVNALRALVFRFGAHRRHQAGSDDRTQPRRSLPRC